MNAQLNTLLPLPTRLPKSLTPGYAEKLKAEKLRKQLDQWVEDKGQLWDSDPALQKEFQFKKLYISSLVKKADANFKKQTSQ